MVLMSVMVKWAWEIQILCWRVKCTGNDFSDFYDVTGTNAENVAKKAVLHLLISPDAMILQFLNKKFLITFEKERVV